MGGFRIAGEADGKVADFGAAADATFLLGNDDEPIAVLEGVGDVSGAHGEDALEIEGLEGGDAVLDAFTGEFGEGFVDGDQAEGGFVAS